MITWLRDWWRGYSDADLELYQAKMRGVAHRPGSIAYVSKQEIRAANAEARRIFAARANGGVDDLPRLKADWKPGEPPFEWK